MYAEEIMIKRLNNIDVDLTCLMLQMGYCGVIILQRILRRRLRHFYQSALPNLKFLTHTNCNAPCRQWKTKEKND